MSNQLNTKTGIILAAGQGSRMGDLTTHTPKPLLTVNGKALIEYRIEAMKKAGIENIVINVNTENNGEKIINKLKRGEDYGINIAYSIETKTLGTGGGIAKAQTYIDNNEQSFLITSADVWSDYPMQKLALPNGSLAHLVLVNNPDHHPHGDFCLQASQVLEQGSHKYTFSGMAHYHKKLFANNNKEVFQITDVLHGEIAKHNVTGELYQGRWANIDTPERLDKARSEHQIS